MKVLMICNTDGALYIFRGPLIRRLLAAGHTVCSITSAAGYVDKLAAMGVETATISFQGNSTSIFGNSRLLWQLLRMVAALRPEVVHAFTHKPAVFGTLAARFAGVSRIFVTITGLGTLFSCNDFKARFVRQLLLLQYRVALRFATKVFFQNPDDMSLFVDKGLVSADNAILTPGSGVDLAEFSVPSGAERQASRRMLRDELGCDLNGKLVVLFPARAIREKGLYDFYQAARLVTDQSPQYVFVHVGLVDAHAANGASLEDLNALAAASTVFYLGFKHNIRDYFIAADMVVLPSTYREGVPRSLIEGLALDKYLITTDRPGCRETVSDGWNGTFCEPGNPADLAAKIITVDEALLRRNEGRSRDYCESKFDVEKLIAATISQYFHPQTSASPSNITTSGSITVRSESL